MTQTGNLYLLYTVNKYDEHHYLVFDTVANTSTKWHNTLDMLISNPTFYPTCSNLDTEAISASYAKQNITVLIAPIRSINTIKADFPELVI